MNAQALGERNQMVGSCRGGQFLFSLEFATPCNQKKQLQEVSNWCLPAPAIILCDVKDV